MILKDDNKVIFNENVGRLMSLKIYGQIVRPISVDEKEFELLLKPIAVYQDSLSLTNKVNRSFTYPERLFHCLRFYVYI